MKKRIDEIKRVKELMGLKESELSMGKEVETEHDPTYNKIKDYYEENNDFPPKEEVFKWIAEDHLDEFKDYYTRLKKMEGEAEADLEK